MRTSTFLSPMASLTLVLSLTMHPAPASSSPKEQGSLLHGGKLGVFRVSVTSAKRGALPVDVRLVKGSLLDASKKPSALVGVSFEGETSAGERVELTVERWRQHANPYPPDYGCSAPRDDSEYEVHFSLGTAAPQDLCDAAAGSRAIALPGYWRPNGDHVSDPASFTFACVDRGVIAKCFDWCYKPYKGLTREHQACTRMAMADYCSEGKANTVFDTFIDSWDARGVVGTDCVSGAPPPWPDQTGNTRCTKNQAFAPMSLEAAWRPATGAGGQPAAICLSKRRWQTLPLRGSCGARLMDPRAPLPGREHEARYCDDMTPEELRARGALHFNYSSFYDVGLWRFSNGSDEYTSASTADGLVPPADVGADYQPVANEGVLWHPERPPADGLELYTYTKGPDHWTTTLAPTEPGWTRRAHPEGWLVDPSASKPTPSARELFCYVKGSDHLLTSRPAEAEARGYARCARYVEGWMPY